MIAELPAAATVDSGAADEGHVPRDRDNFPETIQGPARSIRTQFTYQPAAGADMGADAQ